jgi:hypothetical protein
VYVHRNDAARGEHATLIGQKRAHFVLDRFRFDLIHLPGRAAVLLDEGFLAVPAHSVENERL